MDVDFTPSPDVRVILDTLLDRLENRGRRLTAVNAESGDPEPGASKPRLVKLKLSDLALPGYFSQIDPEPRLVANQQLQALARQEWVGLSWQPGETGHLLEAVTLKAPDALYPLLDREPMAERRSRLELLLLAERFRFPADDWRSRALHYALEQVRTGKSPAPFSLTDVAWNQDLLRIWQVLPELETETPYRVFSVRVFNDSKRFEELKPSLVRLARLGNPGWKRLPADELLRELNLVANPGYIPLMGNWQLTTDAGEILSLGGFSPAVGFPAAQTTALRAAAVQARAVLCIENLTTFHEFARAADAADFAAVCILGNPSPSIRRLLRLLPDETFLYLWSDLDYGGFNILSQLRQQVRVDVQSYCMDIATLETHATLAHPLIQSDVRNLKRLLPRRELQDVRPVIEHLLQRGLKLEQEAISFSA